MPYCITESKTTQINFFFSNQSSWSTSCYQVIAECTAIPIPIAGAAAVLAIAVGVAVSLFVLHYPAALEVARKKTVNQYS